MVGDPAEMADHLSAAWVHSWRHALACKAQRSIGQRACDCGLDDFDVDIHHVIIALRGLAARATTRCDHRLAHPDRPWEQCVEPMGHTGPHIWVAPATDGSADETAVEG